MSLFFVTALQQYVGSLRFIHVGGCVRHEELASKKCVQDRFQHMDGDGNGEVIQEEWVHGCPLSEEILFRLTCFIRWPSLVRAQSGCSTIMITTVKKCTS